MRPTIKSENSLYSVRLPSITYVQHLTLSVPGILRECQALQLSTIGIALPSYPKAPCAKKSFSTQFWWAAGTSPSLYSRGKWPSASSLLCSHCLIQSVGTSLLYSTVCPHCNYVSISWTLYPNFSF